MTICLRRLSASAAVAVALIPVIAAAGDWPGFRGPEGLGITDDTGFPASWSATENVKWKVALQSPGNESPVVAADRVFVTTANSDGTQRRLHCFNRTDGKQLWAKTVPFEIVEKTHKTNPFGASTPAVQDGRVVVWHGSAGLFCYDQEGEPLWTAQPGRVTHIWGYGSSPVIHDGKVFLNSGPGVNQAIVAYDFETGEELWRHQEPGGADDRSGRMVGSWSTPVIVPGDEQDQVICSLPTRVVSLNPEDGSLNWFCEGLSGRNGDLVYTSPLISNGTGVAMGGYTGPALAFRLDGSGDVTQSDRVWHDTQKHPQRIGSGVIVGDHIYMANAGPGYLQCINLKTGEEVWKERGPGANHWGAMCHVDGRLYVTNQDGTTIVFAPNPEKYEPISENPLEEASNSTPAFSDGEIFLRTSGHLWCIAPPG